MASALLRASARRGRTFRGVLSAAAAPSVMDLMVNLLHQSIKDVNRKVEKAHVVYASVQRLVEDKKPYNPFVQWLCQMGAVALFVFVEQKRSSDKKDN